MSVNESESKIKIVIPDNANIGRIIGRNGKHLKQIEFVTNTRLSVKDGVIEISRGADELAQPDLEESKVRLIELLSIQLPLRNFKLPHIGTLKAAY